MSFTVAVAGKGGTGKTTLTALIIKHLVKAGKSPVLAVDADANANLNEALGIEVEETIAGLMDCLKANDPIPGGMTRERYLSYRMHQLLAEGDEVDLLVMGGPEGAGCYCYVNNLLRSFIQDLNKNYPYVIMDNEAGMEHLSRRTTQNVDVLLITSDATARGIRSAGRVRRLVESLGLDIKRMHLVVGRADPDQLEALQDEIEKTGLNLAGVIPPDDLVQEYDLRSVPLASLPDNSPAVEAVGRIVRVVGILDNAAAERKEQ